MSSWIISSELEAADNGNEFTSNYAYTEVEVTERFSLRDGKMRAPFLAYNENKPSYEQYPLSQPFTAWQLARTAACGRS